MADVPHVPPPSAPHHVRTIQAAILREGAGSCGADDLVFAINSALATIYAEGFTAGRVQALDAYYSAQAFTEDRKALSR